MALLRKMLRAPFLSTSASAAIDSGCHDHAGRGRRVLRGRRYSHSSMPLIPGISRSVTTIFGRHAAARLDRFSGGCRPLDLIADPTSRCARAGLANVPVVIDDKDSDARARAGGWAAVHHGLETAIAIPPVGDRPAPGGQGTDEPRRARAGARAEAQTSSRGFSSPRSSPARRSRRSLAVGEPVAIVERPVPTRLPDARPRWRRPPSFCLR